MKFEVIMNMPVRDGALVHRIVCEHPAMSLQSFMDQLADDGYIIVDEYYPEYPRSPVYVNHGPIALAYATVGKVKVWDGK
jgi:hypothetical protein